MKKKIEGSYESLSKFYIFYFYFGCIYEWDPGMPEGEKKLGVPVVNVGQNLPPPLIRKGFTDLLVAPPPAPIPLVSASLRFSNIKLCGYFAEDWLFHKIAYLSIKRLIRILQHRKVSEDGVWNTSNSYPNNRDLCLVLLCDQNSFVLTKLIWTWP